MFSVWTVAGIVSGYLAILFALAFFGQRQLNDNQQHPIIYSLALGVHCTSWAFFGTTTQASQYGWALIPTYLGIILVMVFGFSMVKRIASLCHRHKISSLADFIGLQYQKSHLLAALVTVLCFFGVVPYIAIQLAALTRSFEVITDASVSWPGGPGVYITGLMALFAILFGTRSMGLTDKRPGLMLTIAFEAVVKLAALLAVGFFLCFSMFDGVVDLFDQALNHPQTRAILYTESSYGVYLSHVLLGVCAMFCLPRQFHINFVENNGTEELRTARWLFPLYLLLISLFVLPIALAGHLTFSAGSVSTDIYALALPVAADSKSMTLVAFIGGVSAATSMIIVATLAVGLMISNNLITPLWLKLQLSSGSDNSLKPGVLLAIRRLTVVLVLGAAYLYYLDVSQGAPLVKSGTLAIALLSQTMPILVLGLYWRRGNKIAATLALLSGAVGWVYWLLWPSITASYYFAPAPSDLALGQGFVYSLLVNTGTFLLVSFITHSRDSGGQRSVNTEIDSFTQYPIKVNSLSALIAKVIPCHKQAELLDQLPSDQGNGYVNPNTVRLVEAELASQIGGASARILLSAIAEKESLAFPELVEWAEEASQTFQFNHELLQSSVQHIQQGICVLDSDLRILAWNHRYVEMFDYPKDIIKVGMPIRSLLEFNASRGLLGHHEAVEEEIDKRIHYLEQGSQYKYLRRQQDGRVIELNGSPLPGGGFVTTYNDISEYMNIQQQLENAKITLEERVEQRTQQLSEANQALAEAKQQADMANDSKTRFLAAAGHDLMQPFNAASLFASLLAQKAQCAELQELSQNLVQSLASAEELLSMLLDMTRLDSGVLTPHFQAFALDEVLAPLVREFSVIAAEKHLQLTYVPTRAVVYSDKKLLRRIIQNLLSNSIRYTSKGKILVGVRRKGKNVQLSVFDTGPGIAKQDQQTIFKEFEQLNNHKEKLGLGLGLTIVERISALLDHPITLESTLGAGTAFHVSLGCGQATDMPVIAASPKPLFEAKEQRRFLHGKVILAVDNEAQTLNAVSQLLSSWGARVLTAESIAEVRQLSIKHIDFMLLDYHLGNGETGVQAATWMREQTQRPIPGVLNSANRGEEIRLEAANADLHFLPKPLKPAAFKRLLKQVVA